MTIKELETFLGDVMSAGFASPEAEVYIEDENGDPMPITSWMIEPGKVVLR